MPEAAVIPSETWIPPNIFSLAATLLVLLVQGPSKYLSEADTGTSTVGNQGHSFLRLPVVAFTTGLESSSARLE